jgi:hypothetical protein
MRVSHQPAKLAICGHCVTGAAETCAPPAPPASRRPARLAGGGPRNKGGGVVGETIRATLAWAPFSHANNC